MIEVKHVSVTNLTITPCIEGARHAIADVQYEDFDGEMHVTADIDGNRAMSIVENNITCAYARGAWQGEKPASFRRVFFDVADYLIQQLSDDKNGDFVKKAF